MQEQRIFCSFCEEVLICIQAHSLMYMTLPLKIKQTKKTRTHWTWPKALSVLSAVYNKYVIRYSTCNCQNCVIETSSIHTAGLRTSWFSSNFYLLHLSGIWFLLLYKKNPTCQLLTRKKKCWKRVRKSYLGKTQVSLCWDLQRQHKPTVQNCVKTKQVRWIL